MIARTAGGEKYARGDRARGSGQFEGLRCSQRAGEQCYVGKRVEPVHISRTSELRLAPSTGLAAFMNFASSDAADNGCFASPSGTSTVSLSHTSLVAGHGASDDLPRLGAAGIDSRLVSSAMTGRSCRDSIKMLQNSNRGVSSRSQR